MTTQMHLALDLSFTHTNGRWNAPGSWVGRRYPSVKMYEEIALIAERGCLDLLFFGDGTGIPDTWEGKLDASVRLGLQWPRQDMSPIIAAISQRTTCLGFGLTYSSTFMHPYYVARLLNSLDHVTDGRMAFNVVASTRRADAANYGFDELMEHDSRYDRMDEFVDVCKALWASIEPDAVLWDEENGYFADPRKVHRLNHRGRFFSVRGPLSCVPSPQRRPVLVQAGASPRGMKTAATWADMVFASGGDVLDIKRRRKLLDEAMVAAGRDPQDLGTLWDMDVIIAESDEEAQRKKEQLFHTVPREAAGPMLSHNSGFDFSTLPERFVLGDLVERINGSNASQAGFTHRLARDRGSDATMTRDEFMELAWRETTGYDHTYAGSVTRVADTLEEIFEETGCRGGFMLAAHPLATPGAQRDVVELLVPELQARGRARKKYEGRMLRENLGLKPDFEMPRILREASLAATGPTAAAAASAAG